ncbi:unnamed protein product [Musa textilis]
MLISVKNCSPDLCPVHVVVREAVVGCNASLQKPVPDRRLPLKHRRLEGYHLLHPLVGLVHQRPIPTDVPHILKAGARVEPCVEAAPSPKHPGACVGDPVLGEEALGGRGGRGVG